MTHTLIVRLLPELSVQAIRHDSVLTEIGLFYQIITYLEQNTLFLYYYVKILVHLLTYKTKRLKDSMRFKFKKN